MKPKDPDTFIDIGVSITRLLLIASGQGTAASLIGEGAGLLRNLRSGGQRAISAEKIAADVAARLPQESWDISEADWHAAATHVAPLIDRLSEKDRLAAGYDWTALHPVLLELGGAERRRKLADESARRAFDWVLDVACQHITDCFTQEEALASLLGKINETQSGVQQLLDRPAGASKTYDVVVEHIKALRELAPDRLEDRESEMADLEAFVHSSDDVSWYAMEADMVSGKTAVMASFALNPPDDVHMASFFIRRIGGDGSDRGSFAFVIGAQLAKILGHEYTEPVRDPAQHTEFRQLLRRAATACRSEATPRPLVLLIDGIDEDSYFENPDGADAKSILSLLPRRLPEGVKIITASRPNPRLPEDVLCDADRRIVSLKPSPIAEKSINRKDIAEFFKSDVAVDIGAFLAACGGVLTVEDLRRLLTIRGYQRILTWDVRGHVDRSPGRILTPIDVGFSGQEVLAYRLGHDVVTRAVIRELDPDSFGEGDEPEDERWWAPIRQKALAPYRAIIRDWVKECASRGWGKSTPSYVLSGACFDLMLNDKKDDGSSVRVVLDRGRYNEMRRRSGRRSHVLRMIDRECLKTLEINCDELSENAMIPLCDIVELKELLIRIFTHIPGLLELYISYLNITPEAVLDAILAVDNPRSRMDALKEIMEVIMKYRRGYEFSSIFLAALESLSPYRDLHDEILRLLMNIFVSIDCAASGLKIDDNGAVVREEWFSVISTKVKEILSQSTYLPKNIFSSDKNVHVVTFRFIVAENMAKQIGCLQARAQALAELAGALARAGETGRARRVAEEAMSVAERIESPWGRAQALVEVAGALARAGDTGRARRIAENAVNVAERIESPWDRAQALASVVGALVRAGRIDEALDAAERIEFPWEHAGTLVYVADALARAGDTGRARRVAEEAMSVAERIEDPWKRVRDLAGVVDALARAGDTGRARRVVEGAVNVAERIEDPWDRARDLAGLAGALARVGRIDEALDVAERIEDPWDRAQALAEVVGALARVGEIGRARRIAENAVSVAERIESLWKRAQALAEVVGALARAGETGRARRIAENAVSVAERIEGPWERIGTLAVVVGALARVCRIDEVLDITEQIEDPEEHAWALARVVDALVQADRIDEALDMAERIEDPWKRAQALAEVVGALARVGEIGRARRIAENAVSVAERIESPWDRAQALAEVVGALARVGRIDEALDAVEWIEDPEERAEVLAEVVGVLARAGRINEILKIVILTNVPSSRSCTQSAVIKVLVGKGSFDEAVDVLRAVIAEVEGFVSRQDAADCCATLAAACVDAADLLVDSVDAEPAERDRWLGLARSALARSWLYGASVWDRFDVLLRVAPDLATRLVEERLLAEPEPESASPASSVEPASPEELEGPEGPGGGAPSSR